jgi:hypothetical protein
VCYVWEMALNLGLPCRIMLNKDLERNRREKEKLIVRKTIEQIIKTSTEFSARVPYAL